MSGRTRVVVAAAAGNIIEWYDFAIYGYFAISIGRTFFPLGDPVVQVMAAFGVFAAGYLMRPLGAVLTGIIADRRGRLTALSLSAATMAVPTFVVGLLPGYDVLGVAAPILLVLCRMVQGLAAGGECTTSFTFMIENAPPHRRGLFGSVAIASNNLGMLLGSASGFVLAVPLLWLMHHPDTGVLLLGQLGFVLIISCAIGVQPAMMVESTPREVRCTAIAVAFNLSYGVVGGLSPVAAAWLIHRSGLDLSPAFMIMGASAIAVIAVMSLREPQRRAPL